MRVLVVLGAVLLLWSAIESGAAPTDDAESCVPSDATPLEAAPAVGYRKETLDTVSRNSSVENTETKTKAKEKVKVKHLKGGLTKTVITDTSKSKTKTASLTDEFSKKTRTVEKDGLVDQTSLTHEQLHQVKEVDTVNKKAKEVIITDRYGNVVSDTKKEKVKEKSKKKEKDKKKKKLVHTVTQVDPPADPPVYPPVDPCADAEPPAPAPAC